MKKPTFEEQYHKVVSAYYKNTLAPLTPSACFVGNLLGYSTWVSFRRAVCKVDHVADRQYHTLLGIKHVVDISATYARMPLISYIKERIKLRFASKGLYTVKDIMHLEITFLKACYNRNLLLGEHVYNLREDALYNAMVVTLEELRKIHIAKGEKVTMPCLTRREDPIAQTRQEIIRRILSRNFYTAVSSFEDVCQG